LFRDQVEKFQTELLEMLLAPNLDIEATKRKVRDFKFTVAPEEIAFAMILMKVAREQFQHKQDNLQNVIGYTVCLDRVVRDAPRAESDATTGASKS
jgi:hypothetical protein